jgi:hypothetical protein
MRGRRQCASFRFLGPEGARRLLVDAWGNPPEAAEGTLGMLVPTDLSPLTPEGWGIIIDYGRRPTRPVRRGR